MTSTYPHLPNAPIVEALIDFRVLLRGDFDLQKLAKIHELIAEDYPRIETELKVGAFLPRAADSGRLELSVFRIGGLEDDGVWALARKHVVPPGRNVHGRGDLTRSAIETSTPALRLAMDEKPPRHGNVINWPDEMDDRLALAQELVDRAIHVAPPIASVSRIAP